MKLDGGAEVQNMTPGQVDLTLSKNLDTIRCVQMDPAMPAMLSSMSFKDPITGLPRSPANYVGVEISIVNAGPDGPGPMQILSGSPDDWGFWLPGAGAPLTLQPSAMGTFKLVPTYVGDPAGTRYKWQYIGGTGALAPL